MIQTVSTPGGGRVINYLALASFEEFESTIRDATAISAVEMTTGEKRMVYGNAMLQAYQQGTLDSDEVIVTVRHFAVWSEAEFEDFVNAVARVKGFHEYKPPG